MYDKILVPLDGSPLSENSLKHVANLVVGCRASQVVVLRVVEQPPLLLIEFGSQGQDNEIYKNRQKELQQTREAAEKYLAKVSEKLKTQGINVQSAMVEAEQGQSAAEVIMKYAENNNIDLIVMSTHGRSGITRWAFGSVTDKVVRHSRVPVLSIAPEGARV